jgi:hypothetical protein
LCWCSEHLTLLLGSPPGGQFFLQSLSALFHYVSSFLICGRHHFPICEPPLFSYECLVSWLDLSQRQAAIGWRAACVDAVSPRVATPRRRRLRGRSRRTSLATGRRRSGRRSSVLACRRRSAARESHSSAAEQLSKGAVSGRLSADNVAQHGVRINFLRGGVAWCAIDAEHDVQLMSACVRTHRLLLMAPHALLSDTNARPAGRLIANGDGIGQSGGLFLRFLDCIITTEAPSHEPRACFALYELVLFSPGVFLCKSAFLSPSKRGPSNSVIFKSFIIKISFLSSGNGALTSHSQAKMS